MLPVSIRIILKVNVCYHKFNTSMELVTQRLVPAKVIGKNRVPHSQISYYMGSKFGNEKEVITVL